MSRKEKLDAQINIRLPQNLKNQFSEIAEKNNTSLSAEILTALCKKNIIVAEGLKDLVFEINKIGVNINQIAFIANQRKQISTYEIHRLLFYLRDIQKKCDKVFEEVFVDSENFEIESEENETQKKLNRIISILENQKGENSNNGGCHGD